MGPSECRRWRWLLGRWWFWCLAAIGLIGLLLAGVRLAGQRAWQHELDSARAADDGACFADLVAAAPAADQGRQSQLLRWSNRVDAAAWSTSGFYAHLVGIEDPKPLQATRTLSQAQAAVRDADLAALAALVAGGKLTWGWGGWLRAAYPNPDASTRCDACLIQRASRISLIAAMNAFAPAAAAGDERGLGLMDALLHTTDHVCASYELYDRIAIEQVRDSAYLDGIAHGTLSGDRIARWLMESSAMPAIAAESLRGARLIDLTWFAENDVADLLSRRRFRFAGPAFTRLIDLVFLPRLCATWSRRLRAIEAFLTRRMPAPDIDQWHDTSWISANSQLSSYATVISELLLESTGEVNRHRMVRALGRLVLAWRAGQLPRDERGARACMGATADATELLPMLRYELLSPTRIRIGIDPAGPMPEFFARLRRAVTQAENGFLRKREYLYGSAAARESFASTPWSMELDCAALPAHAARADAGASHPPP